MIETIYSSEDNEGKKPDINIRLPKNIRQIGQSDMNMSCQIYIEENVLSYIKQNTGEDKLRYGVLLGEKKQGYGYTYIFINGMIEVEGIIEKTIIFSDDVWTGIYDNIRRFYKNGTVMGWFAATDCDVYRDMHNIRKIHLDHFAGNGRVFLNINLDESEEAFYVYERGSLRKQPCYHVYFEKSSEFEDYLFGTGRNVAEENVRQAAPKENGKYGIAINNAKADVPPSNEKEATKLPDVSRYKQVASFVTILALAGILAVMGQSGQLNALQDKMEGVVDNILGKEEKNEDYISVNGNLDNKEKQSSGQEEITVNTKEDSTAASEDSTKEATENANGEATTSKETDSSKTNSEEVNSKEVDSDEETAKKSGEAETTTTAGNDSREETTTEASADVTGGNYETYIVKSGETLYSIAMDKYGSSDKVKEIVELNKLPNENYVVEGQKILLP